MNCELTMCSYLPRSLKYVFDFKTMPAGSPRRIPRVLQLGMTGNEWNFIYLFRVSTYYKSLHIDVYTYAIYL